MIFRVVFLAILIHSCSIQIYSQIEIKGYNYSQLTVANGLPSNRVYRCIQDSLGYLWFATGNGIVRYDGLNFKKINSQYESNNVYVSILLHYGKLLGIKLKGIDIIENEKIITDKYPDLYHLSNTANIVEYKQLDSFLIIVGRDSVFLFDTQFKLIGRNSLYKFSSKVNSINNYVCSLRKHIIENNINIALTSKNVNVLGINSKRIILEKVDTVIIYSIDNVEIRHVCFNNQSIDVVTNEGIIVDIEKSRDYILKNENINSIFYDIEENMIVCTDIGVFFYKKNIPKILSVTNSNMHKVENLEDGNQCLILMSNNNYQVLENCNFKIYNNLTEGQFLKKKKKKLKDIQILENPSSKLFGSLKAYVQLSKDTVLMGNSGALWLYSLSNHINPLELYLKKKCLLEERVFSLIKTKERIAYIGTINGFYSYNLNRKKLLKINSSLIQGSIVISIAEDTFGNIWFCNNDNVFIYSPQIGKMNKFIFPNDIRISCKKIVIDRKNRKWFLTDIGIFIVSENNRIQILNENNGLLSDNVRDVAFIKDTTIILSSNGLDMLLIPTLEKRYKIPLYIDCYTINSIKYKSIPYNLSPNENNIEIKLNGLYYRSPNDIIYRYKLNINDNLNTNSIELQGNIIRFNNLKPDEYSLEISAIHKYSPYIVSTPIFLRFKILPHFYETYWFYFSLTIILALLLVFYFYKKINKSKNEQIQKANFQIKLVEHKLKSLQNQMNPHFIFNSLNTILFFVLKEKKEFAIDYLSKFSQLIREMLDKSKFDIASLESEINFNKKYCELELIRYVNRFDVIFEINLIDDSTEIFIPSMLIQPIIENAIKHGVSNLKKKRGKIVIRIIQNTNELLVIEVEDNGIGVVKKADSQHSSTALNVISERLSLYFKNKLYGKFDIFFKENGTLARLQIPI